MFTQNTENVLVSLYFNTEEEVTFYGTKYSLGPGYGWIFQQTDKQDLAMLYNQWIKPVHTTGDAPSSHLPQDQTKWVYICLSICLEVTLVQRLVQHFWCHVSFCPLSGVVGDVHLICFTKINSTSMMHWRLKASKILLLCLLMSQQMIFQSNTHACEGK